jgi:hypothetical protein
MTKTTDLGKGWRADQFTDTSMDIRNDAQRQLIDLAPSSVALLKLALKGKAA